MVAAHPPAGGEAARKAQEPTVLVARRRAGLARDRAADLRRASGAGVDRGLKQVGDPGGDPIVDQHLPAFGLARSEEHTSELQSLMRISYAVFCLKKKNKKIHYTHET